jgi:hypothetical protein
LLTEWTDVDSESNGNGDAFIHHPTFHADGGDTRVADNSR